ncbi:MAG: ankyrin repeat domain-containing protein [Sulfurimonadaceae bacterium]|nr:ankyrin repeat domain-containing protein [Sulfurimonadaceae bacterium]
MLRSILFFLFIPLLTLSAAPIHDAAEEGDYDRVERLLTWGENVDIQNIPYKQRPLHLAVYNEHPNIVELLLKFGANPNARMNNGQTPIFVASYFGDIKSMKMLIAKGAKVNIKDHLGSTPLHKATEGDSPEAVKLLLEHGADLHALDNEKNTPLHVGGYMGSEASVWILLRNGARIDLRNNEDMTPPEEAYDEDYNRISKIMKRHGTTR